MEICSECGRTIQLTEQPCVWRDAVVCAECHSLLEQASQGDGHVVHRLEQIRRRREHEAALALRDIMAKPLIVDPAPKIGQARRRFISAAQGALLGVVGYFTAMALGSVLSMALSNPKAIGDAFFIGALWAFGCAVAVVIDLSAGLRAAKKGQ